ncbi:MAG TPA: tetratricopeptide repeat protein [Xanthobacteraceae bacterium]|nr:tetratricopeptide repeat protein [Xanthobacteraceae bacterium]
MRTFDCIALGFMLAAGLAAAPAFALDGPQPSKPLTGQALALDGRPAPANAPLTAFEAFRSGAQALRAGDTKKGITALEYAAERGHTAAQWKLGRIYAEGDGVARDDLRAFEYFSRVANAHAEDNPEAPQSRYVANAFVALGNYYLGGIPNSPVKADPGRAREMYAYAASYFGDPDAQYNLARMYLEGRGISKDPRQAARWLGLAAHKGHYQAQAMLGHMLFKGEYVPRQAARGLMWLTLARDSAGPDEQWIVDLHNAAFRLASEDERAMALVYLERYLKGRR